MHCQHDSRGDTSCIVRYREGLRLARLIMVMSSFSPLFILWAIRGTTLVPDRYFVTGCIVLAIGPTAFFLYRVHVTRVEKDYQVLVTGSSTDERGHLLGYLFAVLLPLYQDDLDDIRGMIAMIVALILIIVLFWRLNLHYMNIVFLLFNFRIYTVSPPQDANRYSRRESFMLITRRTKLDTGDQIKGYRISNTMYLER